MFLRGFAASPLTAAASMIRRFIVRHDRGAHRPVRLSMLQTEMRRQRSQIFQPRTGVNVELRREVQGRLAGSAQLITAADVPLLAGMADGYIHAA